MPTFRIELTAAADGADLSSTVAVVHAAGGTEVSVWQTGGRPRIEFSVDAENERRAAWRARRVRRCLTEATPVLAGGWLLVSIIAG